MSVTHTDAVRIEGYRGGFLTRPSDGWREEQVGASGPIRFEPAALSVPTSPADVQALVRWAASEGRHLTARGAATGMPGGNVGDDVLVDLRTHFRAIRSIDPDRREITVEPGVTIAEVDAAAAAHGLTFPVQPSSLDRCVVGGLVANNASGARSLKHGAARRWIRRVDAVLADGSVARLRDRESARPGDRASRTLGDEFSDGSRALDPLADTAAQLDDPGLHSDWPVVRKNSSGYALDCVGSSRSGLDLFVGSEGTLGLATEVTLGLSEIAPARATLLVAVQDVEEIGQWARRARDVSATACEFIGRRLIELAKLDKDLALSSLVHGAEALILIEVEGEWSDVADGIRDLASIAEEGGSRFRRAETSEEAEALWGLRRRASPAIRDAAASGLRSIQFIEDSVVPPEHLEAYLRGVQLILARAGTDAAIFGHAGDANVHVNPLIDLRRSDWLQRVRTILEETVDLVRELGGTLAGEHGDGRVRAPFLRTIWGERRADAFHAVKARLDPHGVFNPGVKIPLPGQDPLAGLGHLERSGS